MAQVVALVDDLFFEAKILEAAHQLGVEVRICATGEALAATAGEEKPRIVFVDLNARHDPLEAIRRLREAGNRAPIVGFLSHVQTELAERARVAGCQEVMPRSLFTRNLAALLGRAKT